MHTIDTKEIETDSDSVTVSCTVTGSGLGSSEEVLCEDEVKTCRITGLAAEGIAAGGPVAGNTVDNTKGLLLVEEEEASGKEGMPRGPPGKGWVLTA